MNIVAIGGGNKNAAIHHSIELTGIQRPSVLLFPSACSTERSYTKKVPMLTTYFEDLGIDTQVLHEFDEHPTQTKIAHELGRASMLYTIGGNSPHMIATMRAHGTDIAIRQSIMDGKVHAGTSAGALLPFEIAHSCIAKQPSLEEWDYTFLPMLGVLHGAVTAHANQRDASPQGLRSETRYEHMVANFPDASTIGLAIDNGAAVVLSDKGNRVIASNPQANAYIIERTDNEVVSYPASTPNDFDRFM